MESERIFALQSILAETLARPLLVTRIAEWIANEMHYRWVALYEVTATEIGMMACTGATPPAFPRFPNSSGLCGAAVAAKSVVNVGNVQENPRWLTTFGSTRSEIIVPVFSVDSAVIGLIDVESGALNAFHDADEKFLAHCATIIVRIFQRSKP
jgi:L-methionine (R)-S-oxide reductase